MFIRIIAVLLAPLFMFGANAAYAGVEVWVVVDNQSPSAVALNASSTRGAFTHGPLASVPASSAVGAAGTWTFGLTEEGYVGYGPCSIDWSVELGYYIVYSDVYAYGAGCTARVLAEIPNGPYNATVIVELRIT